MGLGEAVAGLGEAVAGLGEAVVECDEVLTGLSGTVLDSLELHQKHE